MSAGSEASLQLQWIDLVYNTTGVATEKQTKTKKPSDIVTRNEREQKRDDQQCHSVCSIDQTEKIGTAVLLQGSASRLLGQIGGFNTIASWVVILSMASAFW